MTNSKPSYLNFDNKKYIWKNNIDYRQHPELYRVGKGEQGVLICQPYYIYFSHLLRRCYHYHSIKLIIF